jgi:subtilisin family serine protease
MRKGVAGFPREYFLSILLLLFAFSFIAPALAQPGEGGQVGGKKKGHPKIGSALFDLKEKYSLGGKKASEEYTRHRGIRMDKEDRVTVFILPEAGKKKASIDTEALKLNGAEVVKSGDYVIKAKVPLSRVEQIADHVKGVSLIKLPDRPYAETVSQGVSLTGAAAYQSSGYDGRNVKVAIIDLGFAGLASAIEAGVLPSSAVTLDCTGDDCVPTDFSSETEDHGTAVSEIVHEMAPGAELYLMKIDDNLDLKNAKDYCIANGIKVINHSVGWFISNFYDGICYFDNAVCTADHAYENGILWVNSAGNHARNHYGATFKDTDGDRLHNVTDTSNFIAIQGQEGYAVIATLTWDAWPATDQDYDLLLFDSSMTLVAAGMNAQDGTQPPAEELVYIVPATGTYYLAVQNYSATVNHRFEIFTFYDDLDPYVASSSILSPSDARGALAVAAIDWANWTTGPQESFSSQGPTTDGRIKPDISGPDGVWSFVYDPDLFFGTSAASPHVAGAAALILSNGPNLSVSQLWDALTSSAIDMGPSGKDPVYGQGRLNLSTLYVYPTEPDFGEVLVGAFSERVTTIQNIGSQNLAIGTIVSPSAPYHTLSDNCSGKALALGESCSITTRFSPTRTGAFSGSFDIPSNDPYRNPVTVYLSGNGILEITLSSPSNRTAFSSCSRNAFQDFLWSATASFGSFEIDFSGSPAFADIPVKIKASGRKTEKVIAPFQWKRILRIPGPGGGEVYWRVIGMRPDGSKVTSNIYSFIVSESGCAEKPAIFPVSTSGAH